MARGDTHIGHAVSESETLDQVIAHLTAMTVGSRADQRRLAESLDLLYALKRQATVGMHRNSGAPRSKKRNPVLALFGNPSKTKHAIDCGEVLSHNVQAVLYVRDDDGEEYAHGYGLEDDHDLELHTHRDGAVTIGGLKRETGFALVGLPGGEVVICDAAEVDE